MRLYLVRTKFFEQVREVYKRRCWYFHEFPLLLWSSFTPNFSKYQVMAEYENVDIFSGVTGWPVELFDDAVSVSSHEILPC